MAADNRFLAEAGGDPKAAESARRAFYKQIALKSIAVRQAKKDARASAANDAREAAQPAWAASA